MQNIDDPRFSGMYTAPMFKKTKKEKFKVKVDDRFKNVLTDDRFRVAPSGSVDKYGRKIKSKSTAADELKEFYQIDDDDEVREEQEQEEPDGDDKKKKKDNKGKSSNKSNDIESRLDYLNKLSRGEISGSSSSDDDDDDENNEIEVEESSESENEGEDGDDGDEYDEDGNKVQVDPFAIPGDVIEEREDVETNRLAIQNCDWENFTAEDIMSILQSFCPLSGSIKSVTVYHSDYGIQCLKEEAIHGPPKFIWKKNVQENKHKSSSKSSSKSYNDQDEDDEDDEDDDEDNDDEEEDEEDESNFDNINDDDDEEEDDDINVMDINDIPQTDSKEGDFVRPEGSRPGLVFQHEDEGENEDDYNEQDNSSGSKSNSKKNKVSSDIDSVALRTYELSKLRYYFAIAVVDSPNTANHLYREVDGLELEHSSMALDLRVVPADVNFKGRQVRDSCDKVSVDYVPPTNFVLNARQHTDVKCSWEAEDEVGHGIENVHDRIMAKRRAKTGSSASKWRDLRESDMLQYMASSDSENEEDGDEDDAAAVVKSKNRHNSDSDNDSGSESDGNNKAKKSKKAAMLRKILLGDDEGDGGDDFFLDDNDNDNDDGDNKIKKSGDDEDGDEDDVHKVMTFIPKDEEDSYDEETATPAEAARRKREQKKLKRKEQNSQEKKKDSKDNSKKGSKKKKDQIKFNSNKDDDDENDEEDDELRQKQSKEQLELLFAGEENETADRLKFSKKEFEKVQKIKNKEGKQKKRKRTTEIEEEDKKFKLDLNDDRFKAVLDGTNPNFGIDPLANEYRSTDAMQQLLNEQHKRRLKGSEEGSKKESSSSSSTSNNNQSELDNLVKKLKSKASKESLRKPLRR